MSKRVGLCRTVSLCLLLSGANGLALSQESRDQGLLAYSSTDATVFLSGVVSNFDPDLQILAIGDIQVFVADCIELTGAPQPGSTVLILGTQNSLNNLILATTVEVIASPEASPRSRNVVETGLVAQSISGTGKQSISGTGKSLQSISGTGVQSISGTGKSIQSISGTGIQSISGTGRAQAKPSQGVSTQSISGTGRQSISGTGSL
jgi:hypothetical protein